MMYTSLLTSPANPRVGTMACIAGGIAEAYWGVPKEIEQQTLGFLDGRLRQVVDEFNHRFRTLPRGGTY